jgi:hypothetical protein
MVADRVPVDQQAVLRQQPFAVDHVLLDHEALSGAERAGRAQQLLRHAQFPDVVELCRADDPVLVVAIES